MGIDTVDNKLYEIRHYLLKKHGWTEADNAMYALEWYIYTGRATQEFKEKLFAKKPYVIGRMLIAGGSVDEIISRIKNRIGYKEYE
jgi:hypothetical protein